jgi:hypothetical protein
MSGSNSKIKPLQNLVALLAGAASVSCFLLGDVIRAGGIPGFVICMVLWTIALLLAMPALWKAVVDLVRRKALAPIELASAALSACGVGLVIFRMVNFSMTLSRL